VLQQSGIAKTVATNKGSRAPAKVQPVQSQVIAQQQMQVRHHSGPIPAPQDLFQYDQLIPGAADRIIAMAEREQAHRMNIEDMATRADIRHRDEVVAAQRENAKGVFRGDLAGQILGWSIGLVCVAGAIYTASIGAHPTIPIALVGLPVVSIIKAIRNGSSGKPTDAKAK
jgi:uncharacterized membrane protein